MKEHIYKAKEPDEFGYVAYTPEEDAVWRTLYERQMALLEGRACDEFLAGVKKLELKPDRVPQVRDVTNRLMAATGWGVSPVKALISFKEFFELLANRRFPAATFIRLPEHLDYLKEPDIFHEVFGHCPLLTNQAFADFTQKVGQIGQKMSHKEQVMLARLYWFTVEFGLINTKDGLRIYGGGILSSKGESVYALESEIPMRRKLDLMTVLRTTYRYDEMQKNYFIIDSFKELFSILDTDLKARFEEAKMPLPSGELRSC